MTERTKIGSSPSWPPSWLVFAIAFFIPLTFALYTNHAWEDWYITYRASKNLALGNGLVFTVSERIHSFTSPIGTLTPAAINVLTRNVSDDLVLWVYRLINCGLLGVTAVLLLKIARYLKLSIAPLALLIGLFVLDVKTVDFSINGMETAFVIFFLCLTVYAHIVPTKKGYWLMGLAWSGLMWSRPDSFIYICALCAGFLIFKGSDSVEKTRLQILRTYCLAGLVAALTYAPWLIWAWSYYGSFVPHTIVAKGLGDSPPLQEMVGRILAFPFTGLFNESTLDLTFLPAYANFGGWPSGLYLVSRLLSWICAFAWVLPRLSPLTRSLSLSVLLGQIYLNFVTSYPFPWYIPSVTFLSIVVFALLVSSGLKAANGRYRAAKETRLFSLKKMTTASRIFVVGALTTYLAITLCSAYQLRLQQQIVETGNRKQIGLWLREQAAPDDRVFLECLGYIGFYSELKMYDFPGLSSPEVVAARRSLETDSYAEIINYLRPEWLVLRPYEIDQAEATYSELLTQTYAPVKTFDVSEEISSYDFLPGRDYLQFDQTFTVFKRT